MNVAIIGAGISGLMAAYQLCQNKKINVHIYEQGKHLNLRHCPLLSKEVDKCIKCKSCSIMEGVSGAGAFSDGKYNITTEFGGWLQDYIDNDYLLSKIYNVDEILSNFQKVECKIFEPNDDFKSECLKYDLHMLQSRCKHLGTDSNYETMKNLFDYLKNQENFFIYTECKVDNVDKLNGEYVIHYTYGGNSYYRQAGFDIVIFAVGRSGSNFFFDWCNKNNIELHNNQIDIGVRVELPASVWDKYEKNIYEPKIFYRTKQYGDLVRMFCFNGRGEVVIENTNGILSVNGHAYKDESRKTNNTNFALLSTIHFTEPFNNPIEYARHIAKLANMISGGSVLVQRLGDLEQGRRTDASRLKQSTVRLTLTSAIAGDLSLCIPKRQLDNIIEMLHALNNIAPGTSNYDTLLYGVECKYYSARPKTDSLFEIIGADRIYAIGDGAGFTRSLSQAGAQGLIVANNIMKKYGD